MTEEIETLNKKDKGNKTLQNSNEANKNNSLKFNIPFKKLLFTVGTIILFISSFIISAIVASKNYEQLFNYIKNKIF